MAIDLRGVAFESTTLDLVSDEELHQMQEVAYDAFSDSLNRTPEEIRYLTRLDDFNGYVRSRRNPQTLVEDGTFNPNQTLSNPELVIARFGRKIVGHAYSADNVSGPNELIRTAKQLSIIKNVRVLREIVVHPNYQHRGIAQVLGYNAFRQVLWGRPAAAYTWQEESDNPQIIKLLEGWGFQQDEGEPQPVPVFGENAALANQYRHERYNARGIARRTLKLLGDHAWL